MVSNWLDRDHDHKIISSVKKEESPEAVRDKTGYVLQNVIVSEQITSPQTAKKVNFWGSIEPTIDQSSHDISLPTSPVQKEPTQPVPLINNDPIPEMASINAEELALAKNFKT